MTAAEANRSVAERGDESGDGADGSGDGDSGPMPGFGIVSGVGAFVVLVGSIAFAGRLRRRSD